MDDPTPTEPTPEADEPATDTDAQETMRKALVSAIDVTLAGKTPVMRETLKYLVANAPPELFQAARAAALDALARGDLIIDR